MINRNKVEKHFSTHFFTVCLLKSTSSAQSLQSSSCRLHLGSEWVSGSRHSKLAAPLVILETYYVSQWKKTLKSRVHFPITRTSFPLLCANPTALPKPNTLPCLDIAEQRRNPLWDSLNLSWPRWREGILQHTASCFFKHKKAPKTCLLHKNPNFFRLWVSCKTAEQTPWKWEFVQDRWTDRSREKIDGQVRSLLWGWLMLGSTSNLLTNAKYIFCYLVLQLTAPKTIWTVFHFTDSRPMSWEKAWKYRLSFKSSKVWKFEKFRDWIRVYLNT